MDSEPKTLMVFVSFFIKEGKSDEEIIERLSKSYNFPEQEFKNLIQKTREILANTPIDKSKKIKKYEGELDEAQRANLVQDVIQLYVQDRNDYQIKESLLYWGVAEKYHQEICEEAYLQVWKATHSEANKRILLGIVITLIGLPILAIGISATGGGGWQLFAVPFGYGLYTIYVGYKQKNSV